MNLLPRIVLLLGLASFPVVSEAAVMSPVDDFQDGTTQNWGSASQSIVVISDGGPAGAGDIFLRYASNGFGGPNSRMVLPMNAAGNQWQGDYLADGYVGFSVDIANPGATDLVLYLTIGSGTDVSDGSWVSTTTPVTVPSGSGWTSIDFSIRPEELAVLRGDANPANTLANVKQLRLLSSAGGLPMLSFGGSGSPQGDVVAATLEIDNFRAVVIPEPTAAALVIGSLIFLRRRVC
ncbi:hypothetical protein [Botrimarina hoheduenensis]|uniref:PEP-CTERM protein-sorting domain-containing protein n=1 Tax=Botrimarina hoheduenensis TaxID=2528000 RepID=A0A5C5WE61_9BACT|nr:hypothetical protein [Botrimarina hoheduenensis]TWT48349.1 hypothetical protein Pla111_01120 [Botrimarina hoheduenensis]